ncbi:cell surface protein [Archangium gephyra]|nr:cell surface protein [Archangium gephyra]
MRQFTFNSILRAALILSSTTVLAEPIQEWRCTTDSLTPTAALQRIEWARKCGLTKNSDGPANWVLSNKAFDQTFEWAKEYLEKNTARAYSGNLNQYNINYYHGYARYETTPQFTVNKEVLGATANYWKWSHTTQRARPLYPSFENTPVAGSGTQLFPHPTLADCKLYTDTGGTIPFPGDYFVIAYCESSCYAPDQKLRFKGGDTNIVEAMKDHRDDLVTLSPDATLDNITTRVSTVYSYTSEVRDAEHRIHEMHTASGGMLRVTGEHPVITREGRLVKAELLKVGDELLKADGSPDSIVAISHTTHIGKVYNIKPTPRDQISNILVAQGFLVGSARFQNDDVQYMNRVLLFRGVPDEVMPQ